MGRSQEQIDAATASRVGHTMAEKGKSRRIMADLLVFALKQTADFFAELPKIFPKLGEIKTKSLDFNHHEHGEHCDCAIVRKAVTYTPRQAAQIQDLFRQNFPKQWPVLNTAANDYVHSLMSGNLPTRDAPMSKAYWDMITQGSKFAFDTVTADKSKPKGMPVIPYVVNPGDDFIKKIYVDGYTLIRAQSSLNVLPQIMETMNQTLTGGLSWEQASLQISIQANIAEYEAERIVRSEMAMAANAGTVAGARALNEPSAVIKWSTSMSGNACPICLARNGNLYELDSPEATEIAHPNCMCVKVTTFRKRNRQTLDTPTPPAPAPAPQKKPSITPLGKGVSAKGEGKGKPSYAPSDENYPDYLSHDDLREIITHARKKAKEYGINDDFEIELFYQTGDLEYTNGSAPWPQDDNPATLVKIGFGRDGRTVEQIKKTLSHELKHVEQFNSGRFSVNNTHVVWDGKEFISNKEFNETMEIQSSSPIEKYREKAYNKYRSWPWEAEANAAM
jgi:hypothetical protein